jgi:hypothetical protein
LPISFVATTNSSIGRVTKRRVKKNTMSPESPISTSAKASERRRTAATSASTSARLMPTSTTPSTLTLLGCAWHAASLHAGSLRIGVIIASCRAPLGLRNTRERKLGASETSGWAVLWHGLHTSARLSRRTDSRRSVENISHPSLLKMRMWSTPWREAIVCITW